MKKLITLFSIIVMFALILIPASAQEQGELEYSWYIKSYPVTRISYYQGEKTEETWDEYFIYYGNERTEEYDKFFANMRVQVSVTLLHPVPEVAEGFKFQAPKRWYALFVDTQRFISSMEPLYEQKTWDMLPLVLKHTLKALDRDNKNLLVVIYRATTGSMSVMYHMKYNQDAAYQERKMKRLIYYFRSRDLDKEATISEINN